MAKSRERCTASVAMEGAKFVIVRRIEFRIRGLGNLSGNFTF
jgi:hypothetical protein